MFDMYTGRELNEMELKECVLVMLCLQLVLVHFIHRLIPLTNYPRMFIMTFENNL